MLCEECETPMQWRSTNTKTNISKFKCPHCGHVQVGENKVTYHVGLTVDEKQKRTPKYYHFKNGRWIVKKVKNHERLYVGTYGNEETAQKVVEEMKKCDWNPDMIPVIYEKLNIHKVNRSGVCT